MNALQEAIEPSQKFREPSAEELGLPSEPASLYMLLYTCKAPDKASRDYHAAIGYLHEEADARQRAREVRSKLNPKKKKGRL